MWQVLLGVLMAGLLASCTVVRQVPLGATAILPCPSSDDPQHRFLYWEVGDDQVIGPGNPYNTNKFFFEVWSGKLFIKGVSEGEAGLYKCISKHVANAGLKIEAVELVVQRDWEESYEEDPAANAYRAVIAILVVLILVIIGIFAYCVKTKRTRNFTQMQNIGREDTPEEGPSGVRGPQRAYNPTTTDKPYSSSSAVAGPSERSSRTFDNAIVETDIKTSFSLTDYP